MSKWTNEEFARNSSLLRFYERKARERRGGTMLRVENRCKAEMMWGRNIPELVEYLRERRVPFTRVRRLRG